MGPTGSTPIEFKDFSGGLTDHILKGSANRYARADNFLITVDHRLDNRYGTVVYDPIGYSLPGNTGRVTSLFTGIHDTVLFAHANRDIYTQAPDSSYGTAWAAIKGPAGAEAISGGGIYNQLTTGEFQRQVYFTSSAGVQPGKIFRDQNNTWKAVTAGLPKPAYTPNFPSDSSLLSACMVLANKLRASMISHFNDSVQSSIVSSLFQHAFIDKWSLAYFQTQTWSAGDTEFPGPTPTPTPAPVATNTASLYTLCVALALAYEHHRNDLSGATPTTSTGNYIYHQTIFLQPPSAGGGIVPTGIGISAKLTLSGVLTSLQKAASFLDELAQKWYWHQLAPFSHSPDNTLYMMSKYLLAENNSSIKIGTIYQDTTTLQVTPSYTDFMAFGAWIKSAWNKHLLGTDATGGNMHGQVDAYGPITLKDPVDFDSAALSIFWARWLYGQIHSTDANVAAHTRVTFTTAAGSTSISSVKTTSSGATLTLPVDSWILMSADTFDDVGAHNKRVARVLSSGAGTAVLSRTSTATTAGAVGQYSTSWLHGAYVNGTLTAAGSDVTTSVAGASEFLTTPEGSVGTDLPTWITYAQEFLTCLGAHEANAFTHKQANLVGSDVLGTSTINGNPFFVPTAISLAWASFYRYTYQVEPNGLLYLNEGPPVFSNSISTTASYPVNTVLAAFNTAYFSQTVIAQENACATLSGIPGLVNTSLTNYDTTVSVAPLPTVPGSTGYNQNFTIELYRTSNGGTTFYHLDSLTNSTTSYSDKTNETSPDPGTDALIDREVLYTSGGVLANDQPPTAKYVHQFLGYMYYGAITDSGQFFPQRIVQSIQSAPDATPLSLSDDLEDELRGLSSTRTNLIALCQGSVYRVEGNFTSTGQGTISHERIAHSMGCLNARSVIQTEIGVFYAGTDGFYYTDGYQIIKISLDLDATYRSLTTSNTQKDRIYGAYDKLTRRIWWAMQSQQTGSDNDVFFIYYLDYGVKPSGVFTKALTTNSWMPASAVFYQGDLVIGDSRGYLFKTASYAKTDPLIDTTLPPASWRTVYMPWAFRTCAVDMGDGAHRKWITRIHMTGQNIGNAAIQVNSINDAGTSPDGSSSSLPMAPVQYTKNPMWSDPTIAWNAHTPPWKYDGTMDQWRRFPAKSMRSNFKQVEYVPGNFVVYKYDNYPVGATSSVDSVAKTATIATPAGYTGILWPLDVVDYSISFSTDNFVASYLITAFDVTKKIITFSDAANASVTDAAARWQISGIKKEQRVRITAFDIHVAEMGESFEAYPGKTGADGQGAQT